VKNTNAFSFILSGFVFAATLFFRIKSKINISFVPKFTTGMFSIINLRRVSISFISKATQKITQTIDAKRISFAITMSEIDKIIASFTQSTPISFIPSSIQKIITNVRAGKLVLSILPTLASFFLLGDYDPDTLATLDASTLGDLDYTS